MTTTLNRFVQYGKYSAVCSLIIMSTTQCANTSDGRLAQAQGTGIGALIGGGLGYAVAGPRGAAWGAGIGAATGMAYGTHVANQKAKYKSTEDWLDACIAQAQTKRREAIAYNNKLNTRLASLQREVKTAVAAGDKSKLASLKREIRTERTAAQNQATAFGKEAELQRSAIKQASGTKGSRLGSLRENTSGIETQVSIMNKGVQRYATLESQTDV